MAAPVTPSERLLLRCVDYLERHGFADLSLREIAAGAGTSHRMLIYHFGSRDGLLAAVVNHIEAQQRQALAELADRDDDLLEVCRAFWRRISDPGLAPAERLFFEVYASALRRRPWAEPFRETVVSAWDAPLTELFARHGFTPEQARAHARLALAVARGLLLDLLVTEEDRAVDRAAELFATLVSARRPRSRLGRPTATP